MKVKLYDLGKNLKEKSRQKGIESRAISQRTGIAESTLSKFFKDNAYRGLYDIIFQVAKILRIPYITIIIDDDLDPQQLEHINRLDNYIYAKDLLPEYKKQIYEIIKKNDSVLEKIKEFENEDS